MSAKKELIRIAYQHPHLRDRLLPIIAKANEINVVETALEDARRYADRKLEGTVEDVWPGFDSNYVLLHEKCVGSLGIPRLLMPVIEPDDLDDFQAKVDQGSYELFKTWAHEHLPKGSLETKRGEVSVSNLRFTQSHIWFDKLLDNVIKYGPVNEDDDLLDKTIILSKEGYILDGHHRVANTLLSNPSLKIKALYIALDIDALLEIGRRYSKSIGKKPKASF